MSPAIKWALLLHTLRLLARQRLCSTGRAVGGRRFARRRSELSTVVVVNSNLQDRANIADAALLGATVRAKRNAQAEYLSTLIDGYQTAGDHVVAAGNYNSFEFSDGYVDTDGSHCRRSGFFQFCNSCQHDFEFA